MPCFEPRRLYDQHHGFTLIELVVALAVFAVLALMAYGGLASVLRAKESSSVRVEELGKLQLMFALLGRDVEQSVARPIFDEATATERPALLGEEGGEPFLELTRTGWQNPQQGRRSALQRVAWSLDPEGILYRSYWSTLDRSSGSVPLKTKVLSQVQNVEIRFLDQHLVWNGSWPPYSSGESDPLPKAVEVVVEKVGWGKVRRLFRVATP
ncbi:MAG: type II secretion system minor pseudopilin GspJ [Magnetococcus sp. DMHC-6]